MIYGPRVELSGVLKQNACDANVWLAIFIRYGKNRRTGRRREAKPPRPVLKGEKCSSP